MIARRELGKEDGEVLRRLMQHLVTNTGLQLSETQYDRAPRVGEYIHLATQDTTALPGKMRILLSDAEAGRKVFGALNGQTIQVGQDFVSIEVTHDAVDGQVVPGGGQRRRA